MRSLMAPLALILAACAPADPTRDGADVDAIRAQDAALAQAVGQRDADAAAAFYDNGLISARTVTELTPVGVKAWYEDQFADPISEMQLFYIEVEVAASRDLAVSNGECTFTRTYPDECVVRTNADICMKSWRRGADGVWRIVWETRTMIATYARQG